MHAQKLSPLIFLPVLLFVTFLIYQPGLKGDFLFDDAPNIIDNSLLHIKSLSASALLQAAQSGTSGLLKRPVSMMSLGINYAFSGLHPYAYKLTNLAIHLSVGASLYLLTVLLLRTLNETRQIEISGRRWLPLVVSAAWMLHPLNLTPVLYIVQRMTSLETLFTVWGLILFLWGRLRMLRGDRHGFSLILAGLLACGLLATFSKENGVLLPLYMFVAELFLFAFRTTTTRDRRLLIGLYIITLALPLIAFLGLLAHNPDRFLGAYRIRDFGLYERLLTETRVLWFYLFMLAAPNTSKMGLFHDDFPVSHGLLTPPSTIFACFGLITVVIAALSLRKRAPLLAFGVFFFLAGHSLESTILPLELVHEHRNYLPSYGIFLAGFYYLIHGLEAMLKPRPRWILAGCAVALFAATTALRAAQWGNSIEFGQYEVMHHPLSARANYEMGRIYAETYTPDSKARAQFDTTARQYFARASELDKNSTGGLFGAIISSESDETVSTDQWLAEAKRRLATSPMSTTNTTSFSSYMKCQYNNICHAKPEITRALLQAALSNPSTSANKSNKAYIESTAAVYFILVAHDPEEALFYARAAAHTWPNELQYQLNLANILIAVGKYDEADEVLNGVRRQDVTRAYTLHTQQQEKLLDERRHNSKNNPAKFQP